MRLRLLKAIPSGGATLMPAGELGLYIYRNVKSVLIIDAGINVDLCDVVLPRMNTHL